MVTKVRGTFTELSGSIVVAEDPTNSSVEIIAQASSIYTGTQDRDNHLRSPDFLDAGTFPTVTFRSTSIAQDGDSCKLTGDLTIQDVTRPVTFDMTFDGAAQDPYGNTKAAFTAKGEIDRDQWGLTWNVPLEGGGVLVSKKFGVEMDVQAIRKEA